MSQPVKICPQCQNPAVLTASSCEQCGHIYRTQFAAPDQTQLGQLPENIANWPTQIQSPRPPGAPAYPPQPPAGYPPYQAPGSQYPGYPPQPYTQQPPYPQQPYGQQTYPRASYPPNPYLPAPYGQPYSPYPVIVPRPGIIQKYPGTHSPAASVLLGLLLLGLGQMVNGQTGKGLVFLFCGVPFMLATGFLGIFIVWPLALIDAGLVAGRLNRGEPVGTWQFF